MNSFYFPAVVYTRPSGERHQEHCIMECTEEESVRLGRIAKKFEELGLELTAENIGIGVNVCVDNPTWGDYASEIWPNDPDLGRKTKDLVLSFDEHHYEMWLHVQRKMEEGFDPDA